MAEADLQVVDAAPLRYLLSVPPAPAPEAGAWPVLCFLHGYDEAAPLDIRQALTRHGPLREESRRETAHRFIVVAPQLPQAGDVWHTYADAVKELVTDVQDAHNGNHRRTYLTGFSFGGNGVFDLALMQHNSWAALWPVDPTRVPEEHPRPPTWLSFGEVSRRRKEAFIRALDLRSADEAERNDRLYRDRGQDHAGSARLAYQDERIYGWLLSHRLAAST